MMPLINFEWQDEIEDIEGIGRCFVAYAKDSRTGDQFRVAVELKELEEVANRKAFGDVQRKH